MLSRSGYAPDLKKQKGTQSAPLIVLAPIELYLLSISILIDLGFAISFFGSVTVSTPDL